MDFVNRVVLEDGRSIDLQVNGVIDVPENVAGDRDRRPPAAVPRGDGVGVATIGSLVVLEDVVEHVVGDVDITAEIEELVPRPGKTVPDNLDNGTRAPAALDIDHIVVAFVRPEEVILDDVTSASGGRTDAFHLLADIVEPQSRRLLIRSEHVGESRVLEDDRCIIRVKHADMGVAEGDVINDAL